MSDPLGKIKIEEFLPNLKTTAQHDLFWLSVKTLAATMDCYFSGNIDQGNDLKKALGDLLKAARDLPTIQTKVEEIPEKDRAPFSASILK